ncbi:MAG: hypothetical protein ACRC8Y_11095, partial [Chroococcales cyanobacterium]
TDCKSYPVGFSVGFNRLELLGGGFNPRRVLPPLLGVRNRVSSEHLGSFATNLLHKPGFLSYLSG